MVVVGFQAVLVDEGWTAATTCNSGDGGGGGFRRWYGSSGEGGHGCLDGEADVPFLAEMLQSEGRSTAQNNGIPAKTTNIFPFRLHNLLKETCDFEHSQEELCDLENS
ncbi:hypothetical protein E3N88_39925 [Mikania micrantha]|uniref:Uncharacterized protein n=1 Tax=Mikania micrantha TaxID=192012 RepID=A0A5N6LNE7_9ASTR|nr:hypothetical protein E3N88_39925 [Mikania micrantha]